MNVALCLSFRCASIKRDRIRRETTTACMCVEKQRNERQRRTARIGDELKIAGKKKLISRLPFSRHYLPIYLSLSAASVRASAADVRREMRNCAI